MKKILSVLFFAGILHSSHAQSYEQASSLNSNRNNTRQNNDNDGSRYDKSTEAAPYTYNNQYHAVSDYDRTYRNSNEGRNRNNKDYDQRDYNRSYERSSDRHRDYDRHLEKKDSKSKNLKVAGGALILGGIIGVLIASSH